MSVRAATVGTLIVGLMALAACSQDDPSPEGTGDVRGTWTTVTTPDGRICDLWWLSEDQGHEGYAFAGMDCEERNRDE